MKRIYNCLALQRNQLLVNLHCGSTKLMRDESGSSKIARNIHASTHQDIHHQHRLQKEWYVDDHEKYHPKIKSKAYTSSHIKTEQNETPVWMQGLQKEWNVKEGDKPHNRHPEQKTKAYTSSYLKDEKNEKNVAPVWMKILHQEMMKTVKLPTKIGYFKKYSDDDLLSMETKDLVALSTTVSRRNQGYMKIINALRRRLDQMSVEEIIVVADVLFMNGVHNLKYSSALISHVTEMFELLTFTPSQLRRFALHVAHHGNRPPYLQITFEEQLLRQLDELNVNEILEFCQFFFTGRAPVKSAELLDRIGKRVLQDFDEIIPTKLPVLLKTYRLSNYMKVSFYKCLGDIIVDRKYFANYKNLFDVTHFPLAYASLHIPHPRLFNYSLLECQAKLHKCRLKDVSKLIWACGMLVTDSPRSLELIQSIVDNLNISQETLKRYPDHLVELLHGLAFLGIYPEKLLNLLFQPSVTKRITSLKQDREKWPQLLFLHNSVKIEVSNYTGNLLSPSMKLNTIAILSKYTPEMNAQLRKSTLPAVDALAEAVGRENVAFDFILPHIRITDILLCYDPSTCNFVPPKVTQWTEKTPTSVKDDSCKYIVLALLSRPQTSVDGHLLGVTHAKLRQLRHLGYHVITIPHDKALLLALHDRDVTRTILMSLVDKAVTSFSHDQKTEH